MGDFRTNYDGNETSQKFHNQDKVQGSKKAYVLVKQVFQYKKVPSIGAVIDRNKELIEGLGTYSKCFRF